jgi:iron complex outermembrane recepter protein
MKFKHCLLASSALLAAAISASAHAQTSTNTIEELVVTAEKREQSLQDVPVAVSAFTSEKRDLIGVNTIADITNFTPGLEYNAQNDRNTLRGVGRNTNVHAAEGSVAQYSDGIYTSSTTEAGKTPLFVDRVEVLRGPQGTLYGRNAIGGAINIISRRPTEEFYGEVRASYQNYNRYVLEAAASGPTKIPGVLFRVGANWDHQSEGWFDNVVPGAPDEGNIINTKYVEGQLKFNFNENFEGWVKLAWQDWHNKAGGPGSRNSWTPASFPNYEAGNAAIMATSGFACNPNSAVGNVRVPAGMTLAQACTNPALDDERKISALVPYRVKLTGTYIFASEWIYHFDKVDFKYVFGGTHYHYHLNGPTPVEQAPIMAFNYPRVLPPAITGLPITVVQPGAGAQFQPRYAFNYEEMENWWSHEINIASTDDGPFQWIIGGYYYDENYEQPVSTRLPDQALGPNFLTNATCFRTGGVCPPLPAEVRVYDDRPVLDIQSKAVFGQIDWKFADTWKVTAGLRYTRDHKSGHEDLRILCVNVSACGAPPELVGNFIIDLTQLPTVVSYGTAGALPPGVSSVTTVDPATGFARRYYDNKWDEVTGTAGVQWDPDPDTMAYLRYSRGYKAGGFRIGIDTTIGGFPNTDPETADAFEFGIKKNFGRTFQANLALFYYEYKNAQIPITVAQTAGGLGQAQSIFYNIPKAISQGVELETIWQPIDNLQILFNYSYLDAHVKESLGVVDPADPAALNAKANPIITQAQCIAAQATPTTSDNCSADIFTTGLPNGGFQRGQDLHGQDLPNAPKNKVAVNVNYTWDFDPGSLIGSVSYVWRDSQYGSIFNREYYKSPAWDQVDGRLTWKDADDRFTIIAFVKNLTNDISYAGGAGAARRAGFVPGYVLGATGAAGAASTPVIQTVTTNKGVRTDGIVSTYPINPPRTYGIELQYRF